MRSHSMHKLMLVAALMGAAGALGGTLPEPQAPKGTPPPRDKDDISARQRKRQAKLARRAARAHGAPTGIVDDPINEEAP